jgi:hypothetical protein
MCLMALVGLQLALRTVEVRREHDWQTPRPETLSVPLLARAALGAYIVLLGVALVRGWTRTEPDNPDGTPQPRRRSVPLAWLALLIGVGLALLSVQSRPARHARPAAPRSGAGPVRAPADLSALGYLPEDSNVVAGFHVAEALAEPAGRDLFADSSAEGIAAARRRLEQWTGLRPADIDHVAVGLKLDNQFPPQAILAVQTFRPIEDEKLGRAERATTVRERQGRPVYRVPMGGPPLDVYLWQAGEQTVLLSLRLADFDRVPSTPRAGADRLPSAVKALVTGRVRSADLWVAGRVADLDRTILHPFAPAFPQDWKAFAAVRSFGVWVQTEKDVTLNAALECADEGAALDLREYLADRASGRTSVVEELLHRRVGEPAARAFAASRKVEQAGEWVEFQAHVPADVFRKPPPR